MKPTEETINTRYEHMVFFKWNQNITGENESELVKEILRFKELIPGILDISAGHNITEEIDKIQGYTLGFRITFENQQALKDYAVHPVHQSFKGKIQGIYDNVLVTDYPIQN
ncbi:Dabb family protein [Bacillus cereus group sp. N6]|uniref:Dabb family protein n=1 Tax=Bacillus cereus group sp. N6 TaxID=2794583 RepID=UPI0018F4E7AE|nr:Dabb family protein [Bacillus cereus group sp. N6]MBJ8113565.1 Dabb family protein [Bacillus cereus group sp. N6]